MLGTLYGKLIIGLVAATFFMGAGFQVATWKWSGKVEKAVAAKEAAEKIAWEKVALEEQWRKDVKRMSIDLAKAEADYAKLETEYLEETSRPPEIVVEYRDRVETITETIVSRDCKEGIGQLFTFIADLPERPQ